MASPELLQDLEALPSRHLAWLYQHHEVQAKRNRTPALADILEAKGVYRYRSFYLRQPAGPITWYRVEKPFDFKTIVGTFQDLNAAYLGETGAHPDLGDRKPKVNRVIKMLDEVIIELAALDLHRKYRQNWQSQEIVVDHDYRVVLKNDPPTIEIRIGHLKAGDVYAPVQSVVGYALDPANRVLVRDEAEARLKKSLAATSIKGFGLHEHAVLSRSTLESRVDVDLQESEEHKAWLAQEGVKENAHAYVMTALWPDGFPEKVGYKIDRDEGEISLRTTNASEVAIDVLRKHVLAL